MQTLHMRLLGCLTAFIYLSLVQPSLAQTYLESEDGEEVSSLNDLFGTPSDASTMLPDDARGCAFDGVAPGGGLTAIPDRAPDLLSQVIVPRAPEIATLAPQPLKDIPEIGPHVERAVATTLKCETVGRYVFPKLSYPVINPTVSGSALELLNVRPQDFDHVTSKELLAGIGARLKRLEYPADRLMPIEGGGVVIALPLEHIDGNAIPLKGKDRWVGTGKNNDIAVNIMFLKHGFSATMDYIGNRFQETTLFRARSIILVFADKLETRQLDNLPPYDARRKAPITLTADNIDTYLKTKTLWIAVYEVKIAPQKADGSLSVFMSSDPLPIKKHMKSLEKK